LAANINSLSDVNNLSGRAYLLQQWYGVAEEAMEDAIYESQALQDFVGIDLSRESVLDATTLLNFRRLLEAGELTKKMFEEINAHLHQQGLLMRAGTIVDATHHRSAQFDQERQRRARRGDAPGQEGQPVAFRDEGAHRRGRRVEHRSRCGRHGS
jgi:IS5 family transposase